MSSTESLTSATSETDRGAVAIGDQQRMIIDGFEDLIVGADFPHAGDRRKGALRRVGVGAVQRLRTCSRPMPYLFSLWGSTPPARRQGASAYGDLPDAVHLRELLRHDGGSGVVHLALAPAHRR